MSEVRQTSNFGLVVGTLSEKNLEIVDGTYEDKEGKEQSCKVVKGDITVETKNGLFKLRVYSSDMKKDNTENKMYKGFETIAETYISKLDAVKENDLKLKTKIKKEKKKDGDVDIQDIELTDNEKTQPDIISCNVKVTCNDYVGQDGTLKSGVQVSMSKANRVQGEQEFSTDVNLEGIIRNIRPEILREEETGRLLVDFVGIEYGGKANPLTLIVGEDLADDFNDMYKKGDTCMLYVSLVMKHVGESNKKQAGFGRKSNVNSGFDVLEIQVVGGELPYDDDSVDKNGNPKLISIDDMKALINERDIMLDRMLKEGKNKTKNTKAEPKQRGLGKKPNIPQPSVDDLEDIPF